MAQRKSSAKKVAAKGKSKSKRTARRQFVLDWPRLILVSVLGAFALIFLAFAILYVVHDHIDERKDVNINASVLVDKSNDISDQRLVQIKQFLYDEASRDVEQVKDCAPIYYTVLKATADNSQMLLSYGCKAPTSRMFVAYDGSNWQMVNPVNQFDRLGVPLCNHVSDNAISKEIAPVCSHESADGVLNYSTR